MEAIVPIADSSGTLLASLKVCSAWASDACHSSSRRSTLLIFHVIDEACASDCVYAVKYYPAGATTNSASGVTDIAKCYDTIARMEEQGLPLLLHGEVTDSEIDIFDREAVFIEEKLQPLLERFPKLRVVLEHITTKAAAEFVHKTCPS